MPRIYDPPILFLFKGKDIEHIKRRTLHFFIYWFFKPPRFSPGIIIAPEPMPIYFVTLAALIAFQTCGRLCVFGRFFLSSPSAEMMPSQPTNASFNLSSS